MGYGIYTMRETHIAEGDMSFSHGKLFPQLGWLTLTKLKTCLTSEQNWTNWNLKKAPLWEGPNSPIKTHEVNLMSSKMYGIVDKFRGLARISNIKFSSWHCSKSHVKDMLAPSTLSQLLVILAAIIFCVLAYFSSIFLLKLSCKLMSSKLVERNLLMLTLRNLSEVTPWVIGKVWV